MIELRRLDLAGFFGREPNDVDRIDVFGLELDIHDASFRCADSCGRVAEINDANGTPRRQRTRRAVGLALFAEILAAKSGGAARPVRLDWDESGKPYSPDSALHISYSWSDRLAVFAVSNIQPMGIDVEGLCPYRFREELGEFILSSRERRALGSVPPSRKLDWLTRTWTCKEAILKGMGCGLKTHDPASINVAPPPEDCLPGESIWKVRKAAPFSKWSLAELSWAGGAIALAVQQQPVSLRFVSVVP